jgi:pimeloyl-ACP methyl ester carboxylesterase
MSQVQRNGVTLYYEQVGRGDPPILLIHPWGGDHTFMAPQFEDCRQRHRTVAVDLRGHGQSDKPQQDYTIEVFADDLAWLCAELGISKPVVIGHSLGGMITLTLAARAAGLPAALVLLDAPVVPPPGLIERFRSVIPPLRSPAYPDIMRQFIGSFVGFADDPERRQRILDRMAANPQHAMVSALDNCLAADTVAAAAACQVPILYVSSGPWYTDLARFRELCPQLVTGQTVGSGHFHQLEVPDQVNAMIRRFLAVGLSARVDAA